LLLLLRVQFHNLHCSGGGDAMNGVALLFIAVNGIAAANVSLIYCSRQSSGWCFVSSLSALARRILCRIL
jgi:hypothetical protein